MGAKCWVVISGEYSNWGIEGVFTDKNIAEALVEDHNGRIKGDCWVDRYYIQEHDLDEPTRFVTSFYVRVLLSDGSEEARYQHPVIKGGCDDLAYASRVFSSMGQKVVSAHSSRGYDVALKAARDKRTMILAEEAGI